MLPYKHMRILGCLASLWALGTSSSLAQVKDIENILSKVQTYFQSNTRFEVDVRYLLYNGHSSEELIERLEGKMQREGSFFIMDYGQVLVINGLGGVLQADKQRRTAYFSPLDSGIAMPEPGKVSWENLKRVASGLELKRKTEGLVIQIFFENSPFSLYSRFDILIDSELKTLQGYIMYFRNGLDYFQYQTQYTNPPRLEVRFSELNTKPIYPARLFDLDAYIKKRNDTYQGLGALSGYQIIDLTTPTKP